MNRKLCWMFVWSLVVVGFTGHVEAKKAAEPIGILGALDEEVVAIESLMKGTQTLTVNGKKVSQGEINGQPVVLTKSGVGKVNAAAATQLLITKFGVRNIIFTGVAGGINPQRRIGDVIIARKLAQQDYGIVTPQGKNTWRAGTLFGPTTVEHTWFAVDDSKLFRKLNRARRMVTLAPLPQGLAQKGSYTPSVSLGTVVTGDEFIASEEKRKWLETTFHADAVEMEGAAFAQVCADNKVHCVVIRTVSDMANEHSHVDFPKFAAYAATNSARLVESLFAMY